MATSPAPGIGSCVEEADRAKPVLGPVQQPAHDVVSAAQARRPRSASGSSAPRGAGHDAARVAWSGERRTWRRPSAATAPAQSGPDDQHRGSRPWRVRAARRASTPSAPQRSHRSLTLATGSRADRARASRPRRTTHRSPQAGHRPPRSDRGPPPARRAQPRRAARTRRPLSRFAATTASFCESRVIWLPIFMALTKPQVLKRFQQRS